MYSCILSTVVFVGFRVVEGVLWASTAVCCIGQVSTANSVVVQLQIGCSRFSPVAVVWGLGFYGACNLLSVCLGQISSLSFWTLPFRDLCMQQAVTE